MTIDIDEVKVERNELGLWLGWTLATAGGMLLGFLPTILLVNVLNLGLAQIAVPVLAGTVIGFAQWLVLGAISLPAALGLDRWDFLGRRLYSGIVIDPDAAEHGLCGVYWLLFVWRDRGTRPMARAAARNPPGPYLAGNKCCRLGFRLLGEPGRIILFTDPLIDPVVGTAVIAVTSGLVPEPLQASLLFGLSVNPKLFED